MTEQESTLQHIASDLLEKAGFKRYPLEITPILGGGNNQIYLVNHPDNQFTLKKYLKNPIDLRNRLQTEFDFLRAVHPLAPDCTPAAYSKNDECLAGLYDYIEGRKIQSNKEITSELIEQAAKFISKINYPNFTSDLLSLGNGSEAQFSVKSHVDLIDKRILELELIENQPQELINLMLKIKDKWKNVKEKISQECIKYSISYTLNTPKPERVLSPSDFGFHNAIIAKGGKAFFIDFEYAGWDDAPKLIGDFFSQIAIPINERYLESFAGMALRKMPNHDYHQKRIRILVDAYKIKWCLIVLNIFLPSNLSRRIFSIPNLNIPILQSEQLNKAKIILERI